MTGHMLISVRSSKRLHHWLHVAVPAGIAIILIITASICLFELAVTVAAKDGFYLDRRLLTYAAEHRHSELDLLFRITTWAGSFYVLGPLTLLLVIAFSWRRAVMSASLLGIGFGGAALITYITKHLLERERPGLFPQLVEPAQLAAFPSGHSTHIAAFSLALYLVCRQSHPEEKLLIGSILAILTFLVAVSRVYLQVHYPTDVLAGLLLALIWVSTTAMLLNKYCHFRDKPIELP